MDRAGVDGPSQTQGQAALTAAPINPAIFRAYDIRGRAGDDLSPETVQRIGRAYATHMRRSYGVHEVVVGRDNRQSSVSLQGAFISGLQASGTDVVEIGLAPSPLLYFAAAAWGVDGGCNVTASHSPAHMNGLKLLERSGIPIAPEEIQAVRVLAQTGDFECGSGRLVRREARSEYLSFLSTRFPLTRPLKVVVDPGNGVAACTGPEALRRLGCEVTGLNLELDGTFPNHVPDPQVAATMAGLQDEVVRSGADLGVAWDGDGDRLGLVDETGHRYEPDAILALLARDLLGRRPGERILVDVKVSLSAIRDIEAQGGIPVFGPTGHSLGKRKMRDEGILLGGEGSAHFYFAEEFYGFDDAVYAACLIVDLLARSERKLSQHFAGLVSYVTSPELRLPCDDDRKLGVVDAVTEHFRGRYPILEVDGARIDFGAGWALVRASNTEPVLSVRVEAETRERYASIGAELWEALSAYGKVTIPEALRLVPEEARSGLPPAGTVGAPPI